MAPIFYVYEHWRPDTDMCFWVGKGHGNRAYRFRRNPHYNRIVAKLAGAGLCVEVRVVKGSLDEAAAFSLEGEKIAFWRGRGVTLANLTDGGEGPSGHRHSQQAKDVIREKRRLQKIEHSPETRRKIGAANSIALKGRKNPEHSAKLMGRKMPPEFGAKISASNTGKKRTPEARAKMKAAVTGRVYSADARANMSAAHKGKMASEETRDKMRIAGLARWARVRAEEAI